MCVCDHVNVLMKLHGSSSLSLTQCSVLADLICNLLNCRDVGNAIKQVTCIANTLSLSPFWVALFSV